MKSMIVLLAMAVSFSAHAGESFYGKVSVSGGKYVCSYTNNGGAKNMKYVFFAMERRAGKDNREFNVQTKIDAAVASGETIAVSSGLTRAYIAQYCKFIAR
jgi:hypothetical protein